MHLKIILTVVLSLNIILVKSANGRFKAVVNKVIGNNRSAKNTKILEEFHQNHHSSSGIGSFARHSFKTDVWNIVVFGKGKHRLDQLAIDVNKLGSLNNNDISVQQYLEKRLNLPNLMHATQGSLPIKRGPQAVKLAEQMFADVMASVADEYFEHFMGDSHHQQGQSSENKTKNRKCVKSKQIKWSMSS
uniref:Uncharacterized protein n=1 Tax=Ditylenchus dipsaci TaxID=166011 RepID=A0A915ER29_9BILA